MRFSRATHVPLLLLLLSARMEAQSARRIPGYWAGVAAAGASAGLSCEDCIDTNSRFGPSAVVTVGRTFSRNFGVGLEASGWWKGINGTVDHQGYLMATAFVFPTRSAAYVTGSAGLGRFASVVGRGGDRSSSLGGAWRVGAGYDLPLGREVSIAPFINYYRSLSASLKINGSATGTKLSHHMIQAGVGLHWNFSGSISFPPVTR